MKIVKGKEQEYKDWYEKNSNTYGRACFTYAERWAGMMEEKIEASEDDEMKVIVDNAKQLSHEADKEGISRFMYGAAVRILSLYWEYGECLKKWHDED